MMHAYVCRVDVLVHGKKHKCIIGTSACGGALSVTRSSYALLWGGEGITLCLHDAAPGAEASCFASGRP